MTAQVDTLPQKHGVFEIETDDTVEELPYHYIGLHQIYEIYNAPGLALPLPPTESNKPDPYDRQYQRDLEVTVMRRKMAVAAEMFVLAGTWIDELGHLSSYDRAEIFLNMPMPLVNSFVVIAHKSIDQALNLQNRLIRVFDDYERRMLKICERMSWTLQDWQALPEEEKDLWYQRELYREDSILQFTKTISQQQKQLDGSLLARLFIDQL